MKTKINYRACFFSNKITKRNKSKKKRKKNQAFVKYMLKNQATSHDLNLTIEPRPVALKGSVEFVS
jgi:hypothetical protein